MRCDLKIKFEKFHKDNPHIYELYRKFARQCMAAGMRTLSISLITERVRWETEVVTQSDDQFKINNNHRAFYARLLNSEPEFEGMFRTRSRL